MVRCGGMGQPRRSTALASGPEKPSLVGDCRRCGGRRAPTPARILPIVVALIATIATRSAAGAQVAPHLPFPSPNIQNFGSLQLDPSDSGFGLERSVVVTATLTYFNNWKHSWHVPRVHTDRGLIGEPINDDEIDFLVENFPEDPFYFIDVEGVRTDFEVASGLGGGWSATFRIPVFSVGRPHWDRVAEDFHEAIGLSDDARPTFARGDEFLLIRAKSGEVRERRVLESTTIGDSTVSVATPSVFALGAEHRLVASLEAPTGSKATIAGSGGWDAGLRWFGRWRWGQVEWLAGAGYTWLDTHGGFLGLRRTETWHFLVEALRPFWKDVLFRTTVRYDESPLEEETAYDLDDPLLFLRLGVVTPARFLGSGAFVAFDVGENYPILGVGADWSFHLTVGNRFGD